MEGAAALSDCTEMTAPKFPTGLLSKAPLLALLLSLFLCILVVPRAEAFQLFHREAIISEGAGAIYLQKSAQPAIELAAVTDPALITHRRPRVEAIARDALRLQHPDHGFCAAHCVLQGIT